MEPLPLFIQEPASKKTIGSSSIKSTFFGLIRYQKAKILRDQSIALMNTTGFPVVLGYEFYPVVVRHPDSSIEKEEQLRIQGYEIEESTEDLFSKTYLPGELVIDMLVPLEKLKISDGDLDGVIGDTIQSWSRQLKIFPSISIVTIQKNRIVIDQRSLEANGIHMEPRDIFDSWLNHFTAHFLKILP